MGLISRMMQPISNIAFSEPFWADLFAANQSYSGKSVTIDKGLAVTTVMACMRVLGEGVGQVAFKLFQEQKDGGKEPLKSHPLYRILHRQPNSWQTSMEFRETAVFHAAFVGNHYSFINRLISGEIRELIPFDPNCVTVTRNPDYSLTYTVTPEDGSTPKDFPQDSIWHLRGPSWNTWTGLQAIKLAREAIGLAMATEEAHGRMHANGAQTAGLYSVEGIVSNEKYPQLHKWVMDHISGENKFNPLILDRNAKWTPIGMSGVDSQHLETRRFQIEEICRGFRVMPIMVGHPDKTATYASAEQMFLAHVVHTLSPWYERIEQSIDCQLLTRKEQDQGIYAKFIPNSLMRGTAKDRAEYFYRMWMMGNLNSNEMRAFEDMNPRENGNEYHVPSNMPIDIGQTQDTGGNQNAISNMEILRQIFALGYERGQSAVSGE